MKLLTLARDLKRRKARERQGLFLAEGVRTVEELLDSPLHVHGLLTGPALGAEGRGTDLVARARERGLPVLTLAEREFASAADTDSPQGVIAIAAIPDHSLDRLPAPAGSRLVVLDAVQDPGNVGTIIRTAAALGAHAVIALPGTVDLWNAKVVRSAMGASFSLPTTSATLDELATFRDANGAQLWAADALGAPLDQTIQADARGLAVLVAVGNEGSGLSRELRERADRLVAIPISPLVESLNVAVATGILLHSLRA